MWQYIIYCDLEKMKHIFSCLSLGQAISKLTIHFLGVMWAIAQCALELLQLTSSLASLSQVGMPRRRKESQLHPSPAWQRQRTMRYSCQCSVWSDRGWQGQHGGSMVPAYAHSPCRETGQGERVYLLIHKHHSNYSNKPWISLS